MAEKLSVKIELDRKALQLINTIAQYENKSPDEIICKIIKDYFKADEQSAKPKTRTTKEKTA